MVADIPDICECRSLAASVLLQPISDDGPGWSVQED